jgi:hypothetical protein
MSLKPDTIHPSASWRFSRPESANPDQAGERPEVPSRPTVAERGLVRLSAEGIAGLARKIGRSVGKGADTERGALFFDNVADPITLRIDFGLPVPAELFTAEDHRTPSGRGTCRSRPRE